MTTKVEWMSDLDVRSLGMVASRMLTNYIKTREREQNEKGEVTEDEEYFDPNYLEVLSFFSWSYHKTPAVQYSIGC